MKPKNKNEAKLYRKELEVRNGEPSRTQGIFSPSFSYLYFLYLSIYFSILQTSFLKLIHCCQIFIYISQGPAQFKIPRKVSSTALELIGHPLVCQSNVAGDEELGESYRSTLLWKKLKDEPNYVSYRVKGRGEVIVSRKNGKNSI